MESTLLAVIPALVALISGLIGGYLTGKRQAALELQKWKRGRADDHAKEARLAVAELTRNLGAATHSMGWLAWNARHRAKYLQADDIKNYDREMHELFPSITGSLAVVSALSKALFKEMEPIVKQVYHLDEQIAHAGTLYLDGASEGISLLSAHLDAVVQLGQTLNSRVADIVHAEPLGFIGGNIAGSPNPGAAPDANRALQARSSPVRF
jgi:hypothetical protein